MGRIIKIGAIAAAVAILLGAVGLVLSLDWLLARGIARGGEYALGVPTEVKSASLGVFKGESTVSGLRIANPPGCQEPVFLEVEQCAVDLTLLRAFDHDLVIDSVVLEGVRLDLEPDQGGKLNAEVLTDHLATLSSAEPKASTGDSGSVTIRNLELKDIQVSLRGPWVLAPDGHLVATIPDLTLTNVGSASSAEDISKQVSGVVIGALVKAVLAANINGLAPALIDGLKGALSKVAAELGPEFQGVMDSVGKILSDPEVQKKIGDTLKGVGPKIGETLSDPEFQKKIGDALEGAGKKLGDILAPKKP